MLNGLSLFSGIGGLDVALSEYVRPIAYCEIDPYCQGVLLSRQAIGDLEHAPIWIDDYILIYESMSIEEMIQSHLAHIYDRYKDHPKELRAAAEWFLLELEKRGNG